MTSIPLHPIAFMPIKPNTNPLPTLIQTPTGLALLELQGTINLPSRPHDSFNEIPTTIPSQQTPIGRLIFSGYDAGNPKDTAWMKRVYLYVGKHQRLTGEVKKLPKAMAVIRRRRGEELEKQEEGSEELEIVEIIKWKILFSTRPEPVGTRNPTGHDEA